MWQILSTVAVCLFLYSVGAVLGASWFRGGAHPTPSAFDLVLVLLLCLSRIPLRHLPLSGLPQKAAWAALVVGIAIVARLLQGRTIEERILPQ
ncbi:MAG: hypothetical protein M3O85_03850 [Acidobacteriota bacterium]|nr:hypothetical protein [Acidobacteriota bacterium]